MFLVSWAAARNQCPPSFRGENPVRYPFRLIRKQPENCGSFGFNIHCGNQSTMYIDLPKSSEFAIKSIDYDSQTIHIYDPMKILPARLLTRNLSCTPFEAFNTRNHTLLTYPNDIEYSNNLSSFDTTIIDCLSNSSYSTLATNSSTGVVRSIVSNHTSCQISGVLRSLWQNDYTSHLHGTLSIIMIHI